MEKLTGLRQDRHLIASKWKEETGRKVIGVFCCNVPEELIYAAGMLPVRIMGEHEDSSEGNLHFPTNVCPYPVSCIDQALKGRYDYLDGLVVPNVCDMIRSMYGTWKLNLSIPYVYFLEVPQRISSEGVEFFREILVKFKDSLKDLSGREITDQSLRDGIEIYNRNRYLLKQATSLREEGLISGSELQDIVISSMLIPKEDHNELLVRYLEKAEKREPVEQKVKLFISASMLDDNNFLDLIEDCGGHITADDMPTGSRYFFYPVEDHVDPLKALAERYLEKIACPRKMLPERRKQFIEEVLDGVDVHGAIIHNLKACDCHLYEYPYLKAVLEEKGFPVLFFRGEETETELETQRDDIEAFIEMLQG